jgi:hypothetical protein
MMENSKRTYVAGEALAAHRRVKLSGTTVIYADAGEAGIGVNEFAVASGEDATVRHWSDGASFEVTAAGAFAAGGTLYGAADGKVDDVAVGSPLYYANEAATANNDIVEATVVWSETDSSAIEQAGVSLRGRTALWTEDVWKNFNLNGIRVHPSMGSYYESDFTHGEGVPGLTFKDTDSTILVLPGTTGEGRLQLFTTTDNEAAEVAIAGCPIKSSGAGIWALEATLKVSQIANTKAGFAIGLMVISANPTGDLIADAGTLAVVGFIGFQNKEGDGDILDVVYNKAGQAQNEHDDDWDTLVADTDVRVAMYYDGTTIALYKNGAVSGDAIAAADIAAADFPAATWMVPVIIQKSAGADDVTVSVDALRVVQHAS